jgi:hypothetical protein
MKKETMKMFNKDMINLLFPCGHIRTFEYRAGIRLKGMKYNARRPVSVVLPAGATEEDAQHYAKHHLCPFATAGSVVILEDEDA